MTLNEQLEEMIKNEKAFCEAEGMVKNKSGVYVYESLDGNHHIDLPFILKDYKDWLIEKGILRT